MERSFVVTLCPYLIEAVQYTICNAVIVSRETITFLKTAQGCVRFLFFRESLLCFFGDDSFFASKIKAENLRILEKVVKILYKPLKIKGKYDIIRRNNYMILIFLKGITRNSKWEK